MREKNILLTTMSTKPRDLKMNYYYDDDSEKFCDGLLQTEAGTKKILSEVKIDKILVLGSDKTYKPDEDGVSDSGMNNENALLPFYEKDLEFSKFQDFSAYHAYRYRIAHYLHNGKDIGEDNVFSDSISEERKAELRLKIERLIEVLNGNQGDEMPLTMDSLFYFAFSSDDDNLRKKILGLIKDDVEKDFVSESDYQNQLTEEQNDLIKRIQATDYDECSNLEKLKSEIKDLVENKYINLFKKQVLTWSARRAIQERIDEYHAIRKELVKERITEVKQMEEIISDLIYLNEKLSDEIAALKTRRVVKEQEYIKWFLYDQMSSDRKLKALDANTGIIEGFVAEYDKNGNENINGLVDALTAGTDRDEIINLYIDVQGGSRTSAYIRNAVLSMLNNDLNHSVRVRMIIATNYEAALSVNKIINETDRYRITDLVSGMNAFIKYGKADLIMKYKDEVGIQEGKIADLIKAMANMDRALSICDTDGIIESLSNIKEALSIETEPGDKYYENVFEVMKTTIERDYREMLLGDKPEIINVIKWAKDKAFIQQAITLIEAKIPEDIVEKGILSYGLIKRDDEQAGAIKATIRNLWQKEERNCSEGFRYQFNDLSHYYIKRYSRNNNKQGFTLKLPEGLADTGKPILRVGTLVDQSKYADVNSIIDEYQKISALRNENNHANRKHNSQDILSEMDSEYNNMLQIIEGFVERYKGVIDVPVNWDDWENYKFDFAQLEVMKNEIREYISDWMNSNNVMWYQSNEMNTENDWLKSEINELGKALEVIGDHNNIEDSGFAGWKQSLYQNHPIIWQLIFKYKIGQNAVENSYFVRANSGREAWKKILGYCVQQPDYFMQGYDRT